MHKRQEDKIEADAILHAVKKNKISNKLTLLPTGRVEIKRKFFRVLRK